MARGYSQAKRRWAAFYRLYRENAGQYRYRVSEYRDHGKQHKNFIAGNRLFTLVLDPRTNAPEYVTFYNNRRGQRYNNGLHQNGILRVNNQGNWRGTYW